MADVGSNLKDWSTTAASNAPSGSTTIGTNLDDNLREIQKVVRQDLASVGADIASAATTDVGAVPGYKHRITGTTAITSLGTVSAGITKVLQFAGSLTLTHNATSLILPGGVNITTQAGDVGIFLSEGSGNWRCLTFTGSGVDINGLTEDTSPVLTTDFLVAYDASAGTNKKVLPRNLLKGSRVLIESQSPSGAASVNFTTGIDTSIYQYFIIEMFDLVGSAAASTNLLFRVSNNGGSSYAATTEYNYQATFSALSSPTTASAAGASSTNGVLAGTVYTSSSLFGDIKTFISAGQTKCIVNTNYLHSTFGDIIYNGMGKPTVSNVNAFRLIAASGTLTGTVNLYGVVK